MGSAPAETTIVVRPASPADATAACDVLRRCIREIAVADHGHDEGIVGAWLAKKTPENVRAWITDDASFNVVAVVDQRVCGVGRVTRAGNIELCYVAPEALHRGAGKGMRRALEAHVAAAGATMVTLTSSATALPFYRRTVTWRAATRSGRSAGMIGYPMTKTLPSRA